MNIKAKLRRKWNYAYNDVRGLTGMNERLFKQARGARIIVYHGICRANHTRFNSIFLQSKTFEAHLQFYRKYFHVISLDDYYHQRFSTDRFNICITFDDGFANNYRYVLPLMNIYRVPVAYYGVLPCFIEYNHTVILAAQSGDTMTHPEYRYKGLFVALAQRTYELCRVYGIRLVFGFPNQNSHHGLIKLGWTMTENLVRFTIPVKALPFANGLNRFAWTSWLYKKYTQRILGRYTLPQSGLPGLLISEGFGGVYRDDRYLEYKTYTDTQVIQTGNAKAWIKIKNGLIIGDLHVVDNDFTAAMDDLMRLAGRLGVTSIAFQVSRGTKLYELFAAKYKSITSFPAMFLDMGAGIPPDRIKFTYADIDIF